MSNYWNGDAIAYQDAPDVDTYVHGPIRWWQLRARASRWRARRRGFRVVEVP